MTDTFLDTRRELIALRNKAGPHEPAGHACSNLIGAVENLADLGNEFQEWQLKSNLMPLMTRQLAERLSEHGREG